MASSRPYPFQWVEVPDEELKDAIPNAAGGYIRLVWDLGSIFGSNEVNWHLMLVLILVLVGVKQAT